MAIKLDEMLLLVLYKDQDNNIILCGTFSDIDKAKARIESLKKARGCNYAWLEPTWLNRDEYNDLSL
jgi:hypothetical protein